MLTLDLRNNVATVLRQLEEEIGADASRQDVICTLYGVKSSRVIQIKKAFALRQALSVLGLKWSGTLFVYGAKSTTQTVMAYSLFHGMSSGYPLPKGKIIFVPPRRPQHQHGSEGGQAQ